MRVARVSRNGANEPVGSPAGGGGQTGQAYSNVAAMCLDAGEPMD